MGVSGVVVLYCCGYGCFWCSCLLLRLWLLLVWLLFIVAAIGVFGAVVVFPATAMAVFYCSCGCPC